MGFEAIFKADQDDPARPLTEAINAVADKVEFSSAAFERDLDQLPGTESELALDNAMGDDKLGRSFFRFIRANAHAAEVPKSHLYIQQFVLAMEKDEVGAVKKITSVFDRISGDRYLQARVQLISLLALSPKIAPVLTGLSGKEMKSIPAEDIINDPNVPSEETSSSDRPTFAEGLEAILKAQVVLINGSKNPDEVINLTVEAIMAQPNPRVQLALANQLATLAPQLKEQFEQKLTENNIQLTPQKPEGNPEPETSETPETGPQDLPAPPTSQEVPSLDEAEVPSDGTPPSASP